MDNYRIRITFLESTTCFLKMFHQTIFFFVCLHIKVNVFYFLVISVCSYNVISCWICEDNFVQSRTILNKLKIQTIEVDCVLNTSINCAERSVWQQQMLIGLIISSVSQDIIISLPALWYGICNKAFDSSCSSSPK